MPADLRVVAEGLDHPECVAWDPSNETVVAGGEAGQIYRIDLTSGAVAGVAAIQGGFICGVAVDGDGAIYACDVVHGQVWRIPAGGEPEPFGPPIGYPNFPVLAPDGTLCESDSGTYLRSDGAAWRIGPDGTGERLDLPGLAFANGMCLDHDYLLVIESQNPGIVRVPCVVGALEQVARLPQTIPDGLALDAEGGIGVACYRPDRIVRIAPDGAQEIVVDDWNGWEVSMPTNVCFAGTRLETMVIASLGSWAISAFDPGVAGLPLARPRRTP